MEPKRTYYCDVHRDREMTEEALSFIGTHGTHETGPFNMDGFKCQHSLCKRRWHEDHGYFDFHETLGVSNLTAPNPACGKHYPISALLLAKKDSHLVWVCQKPGCEYSTPFPEA